MCIHPHTQRWTEQRNKCKKTFLQNIITLWPVPRPECISSVRSCLDQNASHMILTDDIANSSTDKLTIPIPIRYSRLHVYIKFPGIARKRRPHNHIGARICARAYTRARGCSYAYVQCAHLRVQCAVCCTFAYVHSHTGCNEIIRTSCLIVGSTPV